MSIVTKPASTEFRSGYDRIWGNKDEPDEKPPQCGDCKGTLKVGGMPCGACAPTDDGPADFPGVDIDAVHQR